jgi:hypothetical protein
VAFDADQLPRFSGSRLEVTEQIMMAVHELVARILPDEQWIREKYLRRSIGEILADGFTLAHGPCLDRTLVTAALLGAHGIYSYLLIQEMPSGRAHVIQEVQLEDGTWIWFDYAKDETRLISGRYRYARIPGREPRFIRIGAPKFSERIWRQRPHVGLIGGMAMSLSARCELFREAQADLVDQLRLGTFSVVDHVVRSPSDSVAADAWSRYPVVGADYDKERYTDLSNVALYLETVTSV